MGADEIALVIKLLAAVILFVFVIVYARKKIRQREAAYFVFWTKAGYEKVDRQHCEISPALMEMLNITEDQFRFWDSFKEVDKGKGQSWVIQVNPFGDSPVFDVFIFSVKGRNFPSVKILDTGTDRDIYREPGWWRKIFMKTVVFSSGDVFRNTVLIPEHVQQSLFLPEGHAVFAPENLDLFTVIPDPVFSLMREWINQRTRFFRPMFRLYKEFFSVTLYCSLYDYEKWKYHLEMKDKIIKAFG